MSLETPFSVTCHRIEKRQTDDGDIQLTDWDWEAGPPHYEHIHYTSDAEDGEIDFAPRIIGGTPAWHGEFPAKISIQNRNGHHFCGGALIGEFLSQMKFPLIEPLSMNL